MNKMYLIDKPIGWTSFDVVAKIRGAANAAAKVEGLPKTKHGVKVGHAGTLDPFASGLLIVLVGKENTAKQDTYMKQNKEYLATLQLGATSTTGDPEGTISETNINKYLVPDKDQIDGVIKNFLGSISQVPPIYSAIKVDGKRAYKLARAGETPEMQPRDVEIYELTILDYTFPSLQLRVNCSSGTYIRTLAEDIGKALGCGAYLTALRRTKIGEFSIDNSITVEEAIGVLTTT